MRGDAALRRGGIRLVRVARGKEKQLMNPAAVFADVTPQVGPDWLVSFVSLFLPLSREEILCCCYC